jgi:DNA-binding MarR family transcriptional regulator
MLLSQLEDRNLKRIEVLMALARSRGNTLEEIIAELGIKEENSTF